MIYETRKQPAIEKATATHIKQIPVGSNAKTGINNLERIVKIGENNKITRVFLPI